LLLDGVEIRENANCKFECRRRFKLINSKVARIVQRVYGRVLVFEKG
jgi:hypothetical protein